MLFPFLHRTRTARVDDLCFLLLTIRLVASGTSSEKLCLSWAKIFHIPVPDAAFGHDIAQNALVCEVRDSFERIFFGNALVLEAGYLRAR